MIHKFKCLYCLLVLLIPMTGCSSFEPKPTGLIDGELQPCPPAPKCVSSYYTKGIHHIEPIRYTGTKEEAYNKIISIINGIEKSRIITSDPNYIHAEFEITIFKWTDNTEFLFDDTEKIIHYSSSPSAKIGFWDWGENKRRALYIKNHFNE